MKVKSCVCSGVYSSAPVCVQAGDGGLPVAVQVLRLLQQHVVEHPGDIDGDVVLDGLEHRHVGPHAGQQLAGLGDLLRGLVVHGHAHDGPADGGEAESRAITTTTTTTRGGIPCGCRQIVIWVCLLGEADLQVRGEVLSGSERVLPHHQVGNVVDGEAEFR